MAKSLEAVVTTGRAESVEKILHYLCRDLSTKAERIERGEVGDGYTEWFAAEAFDHVRNEMTELAQRHAAVNLGQGFPDWDGA